VESVNILSPVELKLVRKIALHPHLRQAEIAKEFGVSRSAVNQVWKELELKHSLKIKGQIDFGKYGLSLIFGWAEAKLGSKEIASFTRWLVSNKWIITVLKSELSSTMDTKIYFEAILPIDKNRSWFLSQISRYRKKPYGLQINIDQAEKIGNYMNMGRFDGTSWLFDDSFKFEATIDAAQRYADVIPFTKAKCQSTPEVADLESLVTALAFSEDYFITAAKLKNYLKSARINAKSLRTLRRRIESLRPNIALPYLSLDNIGLSQNMSICVNENKRLSQILLAQASDYPQSKILTGNKLTVMHTKCPPRIDWFKISSSLSALADNPTEICTFIANENMTRNSLASIISNIIKKVNL
jgi:DNA-binding XRE family transcriptional regulator